MFTYKKLLASTLSLALLLFIQACDDPRTITINETKCRVETLVIYDNEDKVKSSSTYEHSESGQLLKRSIKFYDLTDNSKVTRSEEIIYEYLDTKTPFLAKRSTFSEGILQSYRVYETDAPKTAYTKVTDFDAAGNTTQAITYSGKPETGQVLANVRIAGRTAYTATIKYKNSIIQNVSFKPQVIPDRTIVRTEAKQPIAYGFKLPPLDDDPNFNSAENVLEYNTASASGGVDAYIYEYAYNAGGFPVEVKQFLSATGFTGAVFFGRTTLTYNCK